MITQVIRSLESNIIRVHIYNKQIKKIISTQMLKPVTFYGRNCIYYIFLRRGHPKYKTFVICPINPIEGCDRYKCKSINQL